MTTSRQSWIQLTVLCAMGLCLSSCIKEYDLERKSYERGTLGEELHAIWRKDTERSPKLPEKRTQLLDTRRDEFVQAVDTIAPENELAAINFFLQGTLTLVDDNSLPGMTRKVEVALQDAAQDAELMKALSDNSKPGVSEFISPIASPNILGYVTAYPKLGEFTKKSMQIVLDNDGFNDDGTISTTEPNGLSEIARTVSRLLGDVKPEVLEDSLAILVRDMLLKEDMRYAVNDATRAIYIVKYDRRGLPKANANNQGIMPPFVDNNNDGLADLDERGQFVLNFGDQIDPFAEVNAQNIARDAFGRASVNNEYLYEYVDLNNTGLGFLVREAYEMIAKNVFSDMMSAMRVIMGDMTIQQDEQGPYQGFNVDNPLMDIAHALLNMIAIDGLPELMRGQATLFDKGAAELANIVAAFERMVEIADKYPDAKLKGNQTIAYDLSPTLHKITSDKALWASFMDALADPMTQKAGDAMATLISYKNTKASVELGDAYDMCFQGCESSHRLGTEARYTCIRSCPRDKIFQQKMDFSAPESPDNRSQLQAMWHLMWSLAGVPYKMETSEVLVNGRPQPLPPPLIELPGGAEAFLRAIAGNLDLSEHVPPELFSGNELGPILRAFGISSNNIAGLISLLSQFFGVKLDVKPKPSQLTRLFVKEDIAFRSEDGQLVLDLAEPIDADGYSISQHLADGLFEAEASGLVDAVYPMAKAFSDHNKEHLLLELFTIVHMHYPNDASLYKTKAGNNSVSNAANLRSYEPIMREVFQEGELLNAMYQLSRRLKLIKENQGIDLNESLRQMLNEATKPGFTRRNGDDYINIPGGRTLRDLSKLQVLIKGIDDIAERVKDDPEAEEKFSRAVGHLFDVVLKVERPDGQPPQFAKPGSMALASGVMNYMADRADKKRDAQQLEAWIKQDLYTIIEDVWGSRLFAGLVLLGEQILKDDDNRRVLDEFTAYLLNAPRGRENVTLMAYSLVLRATNVKVWVPLAKFLNRVLDPDRDWGTGDNLSKLPIWSHGALMLKRTLEVDEDETGLRLINRGLDKRTTEDPPFSVLVDVIGDYFREDPTQTGPYSAEDYRLFFTRMAAWLGDDKYGMEQVYDLVEKRK